jgi:hypothetical protein
MDGQRMLQENDRLMQRQLDLAGAWQALPRLQPGEDPLHPRAKDAPQWTEVYRELLAFKERVLGELSETMRRLPSDRIPPELDQERQLLLVELERIRLHYAFWRERAE